MKQNNVSGQFTRGEGVNTETLHLSETWEKLTGGGEKNKQKEKMDKYDSTLKRKCTSNNYKKSYTN